VSGVTAGHLIRQRVLTEAKRQLVFTSQPIHEISYDLGFADPSHFARFFRKQPPPPRAFREGRGGWSPRAAAPAKAIDKAYFIIVETWKN
jgi:AraC family transcriptional activator of pobA